MTLDIGATIDRYRLDAWIGEGGFGAVYRARHTHMQRDVALKLMHPDAPPTAIQRLLREAQAATAIGSEHIAEVYDCGIVDGRGFIAMELLHGEDLEARIARGSLSLPEALEIAYQIAEGLDAAHRAGIVHRDLKPGNIFLVSGSEPRVKLLDFGISKIPLDVRLTKTGTVLGTPCYMAPEQLASAKDVDARADVYALGVVLYQMVSGALPFDAPSYEALVIKVVSEPFVPLDQVRPGLPSRFVQTVERALARDRDARWASVRAFQAALLGSLEPQRPEPRATEPLPHPPRSRAGEHRLLPEPSTSLTRNAPLRPWMIVLAALVVVALGLGIWALTHVHPLAGHPMTEYPHVQPATTPVEVGGQLAPVVSPEGAGSDPDPDPDPDTDPAAGSRVAGLVMSFEDDDRPHHDLVQRWIRNAPLRRCQHERPENVFLRFDHTAGEPVAAPTLWVGPTTNEIDTPAARCVIAALGRSAPRDLPTLFHTVTLYLPPLPRGSNR